MFYRLGLVIAAIFLTAPAAAEWRSAAHFGFALNSSRTGFDNVGGSSLFLDCDKTLDRYWAIGFRTSANGGEQEGANFYRLGAGPLVTFQPLYNWLIQASAGVYSESAQANADHGYNSRGRSAMLGWSRIVPLSRDIEVGFGGFWGQHWGRVAHAPSAAAQISTFAQVEHTSGSTKGVEMSLRVTL